MRLTFNACDFRVVLTEPTKIKLFAEAALQLRSFICFTSTRLSLIPRGRLFVCGQRVFREMVAKNRRQFEAVSFPMPNLRDL